MTGDYTKVPLRASDRWTGARMQQGRVLLDHDWNLNLDAAARLTRDAVRDAIGWAGVVAGSTAFQVTVTTTGALDLDVAPGHFWVDGLEAFAPGAFTYSQQDAIAALPASGTVLVYLDVFEEHVQPAEDPSELVDPALGTIDTTGRTRVGYRVRVAPTTATTCAAAWAALATTAESTGLLSVARGTTGTTDPCAPPGDPLAQIADGLFRVEVLDGGTQAGARFAWSYENGSCAVQIVKPPSGKTVQLAPSNLHFGVGDLVEISYLARRADRVDHGALYLVDDVTPGAGGDTLTLHTAVTLPPPTLPATMLDGLCARRWDGQVVGAAAAVKALWDGQDLGITFTAGPGDYVVGDWWGERLRSELGDGIEEPINAGPDGILHSFAPLALVDLGARTVLSDCRPTFTSLVDLDFDTGACTVSVKPGDDLQAAVDSLPPGGGELCLAAGVYSLVAPVTVTKRRRIVINGAGPASIVVAAGSEAALVFDTCEEIEVRDVSVQGGTPAGGGGDPDLDGALTFLSCLGVVVQDCELSCPDQSGRTQTCLTVRSAANGRSSDGIRIERNRLSVGAWQTGILVVDTTTQTIGDNTRAALPGAPGRAGGRSGEPARRSGARQPAPRWAAHEERCRRDPDHAGRIGQAAVRGQGIRRGDDRARVRRPDDRGEDRQGGRHREGRAPLRTHRRSGQAARRGLGGNAQDGRRRDHADARGRPGDRGRRQQRRDGADRLEPRRERRAGHPHRRVRRQAEGAAECGHRARDP